MFKEFPDDNKNDDFLNEFRQKISDQSDEIIEEKREELKRSKSIFLGITGGIVLAGIVGWMILAPQYRTEKDKEIPVIRRPQTAIRVQPNEPGGMEIPNQDKSVYNIIEKKEDNGVENLLPPPESPKLPEIVAQADTAPSVPQDTVLPEAEKIVQKAEAPVVTTQDIIKQAEESAPETAPAAKPKAELPQTAAVSEPAQSVPVQSVAKEEPKPEPKPTPKAEPKAEPKQEPKVEAQKVAAAVSGNWQVQLMSSPNKPAIEKAKADLAKKYKLGNQPFEIETAVLDKNKTFYRLKVGAYKTRAEADKLCNNIKALGGTCIVKKK